MASSVVRTIVGLLYFAIGIFWAFTVVPVTLFKAILGGRNGISKLFHRKKLDKYPAVGTKNYNHDYIRTKSGMKFHYVHAGSEDNPLMLCIHGFPECWYSWKHILRKFSSKYHVVAYDMRGYGDSDKPKSVGEYHMTYLVNDVQEIITALGYQRAVIVAHDWGGAVAWQVPLFFPEVVDKLIIMNAPRAPGFYKFMKKYPSQLLRSWYMFFFQLPYLAEIVVGQNNYEMLDACFKGAGDMSIQNEANRLTAEEVDIYKYSAGQNLRCAINYYRAMNPLYYGMRLRPVTKQIVQPTLVIWGSKDGALDVRMVPYVVENLPNASTCIVEGASHWVALDEPDKVMNEMKSFLSKTE